MAAPSTRLFEAMAGVSFLFHPPGWTGEPGLGLAGLSGVPEEEPWDAFASAYAPGMRGDEQRFVVGTDEAILAEPDVPLDALDPLAAALSEQLEPPFCAVAVRHEDDVWTAVANRAEVFALPEATAEEIEVSCVDGEIGTRVDGTDSDDRYRVLEGLLEREDGDASVIAHRFVGSIWVAEVFPL